MYLQRALMRKFLPMASFSHSMVLHISTKMSTKDNSMVHEYRKTPYKQNIFP